MKYRNSFHEYKDEIDKMTKLLIEENDHTTLKQVLRNYDKLVKEHSLEDDTSLKLPYWCYN